MICLGAKIWKAISCNDLHASCPCRPNVGSVIRSSALSHKCVEVAVIKIRHGGNNDSSLLTAIVGIASANFKYAPGGNLAAGIIDSLPWVKWIELVVCARSRRIN